MSATGSPATSPVSPSDEDLAAALKSLREANPSTGAAKLLPLLLEANPGWTVSEKRLRKALQKGGLSLAGPAASGSISEEFPTSKMIPSLDLSAWSKKIKVEDFGMKKGKGLVATKAIEEGEYLWLEDPLVFAPESDLDDHIRQGRACLHCAKPIQSTGYPISCQCNGFYCNRLCSTRGNAAHAFLCPSQNPASIPFVSLVRSENWKAPLAWAKIVAVLLSHAVRNGVEGNQEFQKTLDFVHGLAGLSLDKRTKVLSGWEASQTASEELWKKTHQAFVEAFVTPKTPAHAKALAKLKGKPSSQLPADVASEFFNYPGFLLGLGKMSLNLESMGGLYILHSHLNHNCTPNTSIRHLNPANIQRITVIAKRAIAPGEELLVSYVDPSSNVWARRRQLKDWGFGVCECERCGEEAKNAPEGEAGGEVQLEDELRGFLGV